MFTFLYASIYRIFVRQIQYECHDDFERIVRHVHTSGLNGFVQVSTRAGGTA